MQRRLAAVLVADMVGYSRLMSANETDTIQRHQFYRSTTIDPGIAGLGGRIVNTSGDGLLAEFGSVIDAVKFAVETQQAVNAAEADSEPQRRIRYRVGIHVGDIVVDGDDILGDSVNIAARLESLAEPGGVCISDNVRNSIKGKLDFDFAIWVNRG